MNMKSRRKFLRNTGLITGGIITSSFANSSIKPYSKIVGANDRIKFGVIGCKGMGRSSEALSGRRAGEWCRLHCHGWAP